ncbi:MAG TPA: winged helix-turn-helix domain-containing protein [Caulobacteraceae bacterium]|nr:winged helix-turn-helix domain-containing protein [Caulobacteraceae bacterium]
MRLFTDGSPMMGAPAPRREPGPIRLALEGDFRLGRLCVRPSLREVTAAGRREVVEPRVMQVLVALAAMRGQVVSRDELIDSCWDGRVVGEDAINRTIGRLRRLAESFDHSFTIDTVARVGYRLCEAGAAGAPGDAIAAPRPAAPRALALNALVTIAIASLAGGGLIYAMRALAPARWSVASSKLLVSSEPIERHPAISPDGRTIAYVAGYDTFNRQIFLRDIAGGDPVRVTNEPGDHTSVAWSPDASALAYAVYTPGQPCTLMLRQLQDGASRVLGRCLSDERTELTWARSGESLFFVDRPNASSSERIVKLDLASGRRADVTSPPAGSLGDTSVGLSPDGRWMSFNRAPNETSEAIMVRDLRTGRERLLGRLSAWLEPGGWTSDSRAILMAGRVNGDNVVWAYPVDGGNPIHVMSGPLEMGRVVTGPGDIAAVEIDTAQFNLASPPAQKGGQPQFLDTMNAVEAAPAFASDGTLAMAGERSGDVGVWIMAPGGDFQRLTIIHAKEEPTGLSFSPDASRLAFATEVGGGPGLVVVDRRGRTIAAVRFAGAEIGGPVWAADGRALIFPGRDAGGWRLWRVPAAPGGTPRPASGYGWLSVQARGQELYGVRADAPGVWRIDGTPRRITALPLSAFPTAWTIAGDAIVYVDNLAGRTPLLMSQPIAGGSPRLLAEAPNLEVQHPFAVDPRSGRIVYSARRAENTNLDILHLARS